MTVLFVGTRAQLDAFMLKRGINPSEHGKGVKWATNGPNHLHLPDAPIEIVKARGHKPGEFEEQAMRVAKSLNAIEEHQRG